MRIVAAGLLGALVLSGVPALAPGAAAALPARTVGATAATAVGTTTAGHLADEPRLHLVSLTGAGTAGLEAGTRVTARTRMLRDQDALRDLVGAGEPAYRWTTALNGMALSLSAAQARRLASDPRVARVERDRVRPLAAVPTATTATAAAATAAVATTRGPAGRGLAGRGPVTGGRGVVVGVVDSGLDPDVASFATLASQGTRPRPPASACQSGPEWAAARCGGKITAARWFVEGFGRDALRSGAVLSPRDDEGHGTQVAAVAAGNAGVPVRVRGRTVGTAGGQAPDARIAVYKACWTAPDPDDDGCASADLVAAIDRAVADGVDVLNLSTAGSGDLDTVERALLGAAEADVVVLGAAGNDPDGPWAAHPTPWVTTVGGTQGSTPRGVVRLGGGGPALRGASAATAPVSGRLVRAAVVRRPGVEASRARVCEAGSLDAARVAGRVVVCERGVVGRVDKSAAVALADGVGMVLLDGGPGGTSADFHAVPTVHLAAAPARRLTAWLRTHPDARATLAPAGTDPGRGLAGFTPPGDPAGDVLKPDVLAPATGLLGPVPGTGTGAGFARWTVGSGTSLATAWASGTAAAVRGRHPGWSAVRVRSALATGTVGLPGVSQPLRSGAGRVDLGRAEAARLTFPETQARYRAWLEGRRGEVNTPSVLLSEGRRTATRTLRSTASTARYFSSSAHGFRTRVQVTPAAVRLDPGEEVTFRVTAPDASGRRGSDGGVVLWRGADGSRARVPVVVTR